MNKIADSLKSNKTHLRVCIQYEVLDKKSPSESYKNFCRKLGDDVMDYKEFEFWYMRFSDGKLDLEFDMSLEPKKKTFSDLPVKIVGKCVNLLNPNDRLLTRLVSTGLQSVVDDQKPRYRTVMLWMHADRARINLDDYEFNYEKVMKWQESMETEGKEVTLKLNGDAYLDAVESGLVGTLINPELKLESISCHIDKEAYEDWGKLMERASKHLPSEIKSQMLYIFSDQNGITDVNFILPILKLLKPGDLESIVMHVTEGQITHKEISQTDQWKQAKGVFTNEAISNVRELPYFYHLKQFHIKVDGFSMDDLIALRNNLQKSQNFGRGFIGFAGNINISRDEFATLIDAVVQNDGTVRDAIPNSSEYLQFAFHGTRMTAEKKREEHV